MVYGVWCMVQVSSQPPVYADILPHLTATTGSPTRGAHVLGAHVEGPFITVHGAHAQDNLRCARAGVVDIDGVYGATASTARDAVAIVTLSPEIPGGVLSLFLFDWE